MPFTSIVQYAKLVSRIIIDKIQKARNVLSLLPKRHRLIFAIGALEKEFPKGYKVALVENKSNKRDI